MIKSNDRIFEITDGIFEMQQHDKINDEIFETS